MKIDIIGSVASGKTTLAKRISKKYGVPYYEKDNIVWKRTANGDIKRSPEERDNYFYTNMFLNIPIFISDWNDSPLFIILDNYVQWVMLAAILIVAVVFLYKKPVRE